MSGVWREIQCGFYYTRYTGNCRKLNFIWLVADTASEKAIFVLRCGLTTMPYAKPEFQFLPGTTVVIFLQLTVQRQKRELFGFPSDEDEWSGLS